MQEAELFNDLPFFAAYFKSGGPEHILVRKCNV